MSKHNGKEDNTASKLLWWILGIATLIAISIGGHWASAVSTLPARVSVVETQYNDLGQKLDDTKKDLTGKIDELKSDLTKRLDRLDHKLDKLGESKK